MCGTTLVWWVFQLRWDVPGCGESLVRVWWEVVVFPLLLRCRMVGAVGRCDGVGCLSNLCWAHCELLGCELFGARGGGSVYLHLCS